MPTTAESALVLVPQRVRVLAAVAMALESKRGERCCFRLPPRPF